jgi:hypothetical protein
MMAEKRTSLKNRKKPLPIGVDIFSKLINNGSYYVDKTMFIAELLEQNNEVTLFTRPRRFGKSLNMSMLKAFFEIGCQKELFDGLKIAKEKELCEEYMGKFPVIFISLKDVCGNSFASAENSLKYLIGNEAIRFSFLENSNSLTEMQKNMYKAIVRVGDEGSFIMSEDTMKSSLNTLCILLSKHYNRKVILLIDEYDVPLDKAFQNGYYDEMVALIRNMFSSVLKTNPNLQFAVLTGCLRVSKESIFTGLNNLRVLSITDVSYDEYFGFTDGEVKELLEYYELSEHYDEIKTWYDGYKFGNASVYCPWDVINYCYDLRANPKAIPSTYWANTSGNALVRRFIDKSTCQTQKEIEQLISGESVVKPIRQELTYSELDGTIENLWSVLFLTGYLTQVRQVDESRYELTIPNKEIRGLFIDNIKNWFSDKIKSDVSKLDTFCEAFAKGDAATIERLFSDYLWNTISIRDTAAQKGRKENFYHGILLGLLSHKENWSVMSNEESGEGYSDILVEVPESRIGIVIELKYAEGDKLEAACDEALSQINEKQYDSQLKLDGMHSVIKYGIACFRKHCKVVKR